jgi:hypothetical protein
MESGLVARLKQHHPAACAESLQHSLDIAPRDVVGLGYG